MLPFPTTTAKNAGAAFWAAGLESTFLSSALRFLAPSSVFASLSLTSMAPPAPVVLNDQIDLKALLISEIMDTVVDTAVGGKEHAHVAQNEVLKEHPQRLHITKQPLRGSSQQRRRK